MYLSRLTLNPRTRRVQRELANFYELHRTLLRAFPETLPAGERILFRLDTDERSGIPTLLLQSHTRPDWAWLGDPGARDYLLQAPETKSFELALTSGQHLAFRLRANPTAKHWREEGGESKAKRDPLMREEEQRAWLERKGTAGGFRVLHLTIADEGTLRGRTAGEERRALHFRAVRFEGILEVLDPDQLWQTVQNGIGSGKSFGFGLLSLAPAP